ncbi:MAG: sigma-70 family RNA polymerase sigma factor [Bacteroidaceae bacterium]|nr:sigma-70 family RNA polymerase sigma factor [Bacteroidaceae bacterium]
MTLPLLLKPFSSLTDDELMQRVSIKDDDRAFGELYRRYARRLMVFFFRQLNGDEALSADLTQDAFMRVWAARDKFSGTHFRTWIFTISYNLLKNHYRHDEHQKQYEWFSKQTKEEVADNHIIEQMDNDTFDQALRKALEMLPAESRLLFSFRFEEELTVPEIAELMGLAEGTVKSRLYTLTQTLKQKLYQHEYIRR